MSKPTLKYAKSHEWIRVDDDGIATVGISEFAQDALGDVVFVELPQSGATVNAGQEIAVVESVKAASDIYSPVSGRVTAVNDALRDKPELINSSPLADGWLFRIELSKAAELDALLDASAYDSSHD
ncbi:MAG: glycine cleavage system protein GcvH [Pseudomonadota bacterium]|nr:glycine cleavage system protein GcvH [Pseudomonadota bacterium]